MITEADEHTHCYTFHKHKRIPHTHSPGGLGSVVDGKDVIAVDSDGRHSVAGTTCSDSVTAILLIGRSRDGVTVIPDSKTQSQFSFES